MYNKPIANIILDGEKLKTFNTIPICRWHAPIPKISEKIHQKAARHHKYLQQICRIDKQSTKISTLSICLKWTGWERL
jgi:hypothetical protein